MLNSNNVHNVQKLVQPINAQFALIYSNSSKIKLYYWPLLLIIKQKFLFYQVNRKSKKKAFQMKITKSVSCHAISNGLETL